MSLSAIIFIAFGLAADAFAVSIAEGIVVEGETHKHTLRVSIAFGAFQGVMPIFGWYAGTGLRSALLHVDHWVAFGLLALIGGKMLFDAVTGAETEETTRSRESRGFRLMLLAVATSIDAFAVGLSIAMLGVSVWGPAAIIALVAAVMSAVGVQAGSRIGTRLGRKAEVVGGLVLIGIGLEILITHLGG